ncbi:hypothetical protein SAMN05877809_11261 [Rhodobacter sp. JA431]|uniref:hypothetical protein n=1 Tax=Rhodobacter sp. JA431 TaxID=570013 RepID=UPI000BCC2594|nr:hypothetical protein [Rhodobacter sp. JA431]SOC20544.1 hypothetical protein SAMN05877809_11261 [Rhodobacter sp. JA431]
MTTGITYAGELGRVGLETSPQEAVEIICTDPRFVEKAAAKKPNLIVRLFNGAVSFPRDWWYGATFIATRVNIFDTDGRMATDATYNKLFEIGKLIYENPVFVLRVSRLLVGHLVHYPEFYGRAGATVATSLLTTALMSYAGIGNYTPVVGLINLILTGVGAAARAIDQGASTLAEIIVAVALGESDPALAAKVSQKILETSPSDGNYDIPDEQEKRLLYILDGVMHCLKNPAQYINRGEERKTNWVPVGQVSSARPRGVIGLIRSGYETNALDALSEDALMPGGVRP